MTAERNLHPRTAGGVSVGRVLSPLRLRVLFVGSCRASGRRWMAVGDRAGSDTDRPGPLRIALPRASGPSEAARGTETEKKGGQRSDGDASTARNKGRRERTQRTASAKKKMRSFRSGRRARHQHEACTENATVIRCAIVRDDNPTFQTRQTPLLDELQRSQRSAKRRAQWCLARAVWLPLVRSASCVLVCAALSCVSGRDASSHAPQRTPPAQRQRQQTSRTHRADRPLQQARVMGRREADTRSEAKPQASGGKRRDTQDSLALCRTRRHQRSAASHRALMSAIAAAASPSPSSSRAVAALSAPSLLQPCTYRTKNASKQMPRELYLRSDLTCHTLCCGRERCRAEATTTAALGGQADRIGVLNPHATDHYVVPSFLALQRFMTLFSRARSVHLILLRTHATQAGAAMTRQMRELLDDGASARRVVLFENESHAETATVQRRAEKESKDDRNKRAVRRAAKWMAAHIHNAKRIILIEEDEGPTEGSVQRETAEPARMESEAMRYPRETGGITVHSLQSYLVWLRDRTPPAATAASSSTASSSDLSAASASEASSLLSLYASLLESEKSKVRQKLQQHAANQELEALLATCKVELARGLSEAAVQDSHGASPLTIDDASSSTLPPLPTAVTPVPAVAPSPSPESASHPSDLEYDEHIPLELALEAVRRGLLYRGHVRVNKHHAQIDAALDLNGRMIDATSGAFVESAAAAPSAADGRLTRVGEIFISGQPDRNRAIDGDEAIVQLLPANLWRAPTQRKKIAVKEAAGVSKDGEEEQPSAASDAESARPVPTGRVVCLVQRNRRPYVCTLQLDGGGQSGNDVLCVPMDQRIPKLRIRTHQSAALASQRILVAVDDWPADSKYPSGVYLHSLGLIGAVETGVRCILHELSINHPPFSVNQLKCLPPRDIDLAQAADRKYKVGSGYHSRGEPTPFSWEIPAEALQGRLDLRQSHRDAVCSIDPIGCEDIDDALSVLNLPNGNVQVGVHIANVSYFVPPGSLLDQEAQRRGTSVYLVDRRLDMLPAVLSADLCSLRGGCDRLCLSVLWEIEPLTGRVVHTWYGPTVIYNAFALSYEEAQYIVDTVGGTRPLPKLDPKHPDYHLSIEERYDRAPQSSLTSAERKALYPKLLMLVQLGRQLNAERVRAGALELFSVDIKFKLDGSKQVVGVQSEAELEVHNTIAEWMVFANSTVAYAIWQRFPKAALLRHHPFPAPGRFDRLLEMARNLDLELDVTSNKTLADSLRKAEEVLEQRDAITASPEAAKLLASAASSATGSSSQSALDSHQSRHWMIRILKELASRAMSEAQYFSTGSVEHPSEFYHYGLSARFYAHFTSPIRRYADLIVHRQLMQVIEMERQEKAARKAEGKALKVAAASGGMNIERSLVAPRSFGGASAASLVSTPGLLLGNTELSALARHLNAKNRNAKYAGSASQELMLACFLSGQKRETESQEDDEPLHIIPRPVPQAPLIPRVERCEALIVSLRANGFIVLLPSFHYKGALLLVDGESRALLSHPLSLAYPADPLGSQDSSSLATGPAAKVVLDERSQCVTLSLSAPLSAPLLAPADLVASQRPLPLSRTFRVFDPVLVDVTLRPNASRYRTPKPVLTLVWQPDANAKGAERPVAAVAAAAQSKPKAAPAQQFVPLQSNTPMVLDKSSVLATRIPAPAAASGSVLDLSSYAAPAGAKLKKAAPTGGLASGPLFALLQEAAHSQRHSKADEDTRNETGSDDEAIAAERASSASRIAIAERKQQHASRSAVRVRRRYVGALGGRLLLTPSGAIPPELFKAHILQAQAKRADDDEWEEDGQE